MPVPNNLSSLGLYIAYAMTSRIAEAGSLTSADSALLKALKKAAKLEKPDAEEIRALLRAASSVLFLLYVLASYEQSVKSKQQIAQEMRLIKEQMQRIKGSAD